LFSLFKILQKRSAKVQYFYSKAQVQNNFSEYKQNVLPVTTFRLPEKRPHFNKKTS